MTTATPSKPKSASAELKRLDLISQKARAIARAARDKRDAWDRETEALGYQLTAHLEAHPDEASGAQRLIQPDTEAARIEAEIKRRKREPNPRQAEYEAARDSFHAKDLVVQQFKKERVLDRVAELERDAATADERIRKGFELLCQGCEAFAAVAEATRAIVIDTPGLDGRAVDLDGRPIEWNRLAREALESEIAQPGLTFNAKQKVSG